MICEGLGSVGFSIMRKRPSPRIECSLDEGRHFGIGPEAALSRRMDHSMPRLVSNKKEVEEDDSLWVQV